MEFLKTPPEFPGRGFSCECAHGGKIEGIEAEPSAKDAEAAPAEVSLETKEEARRAIEAALRSEEAAREATRILELRRESFQSKVDWAFSVLDAASLTARRDPANMQRCFRNLMKKLHPDRVGHSDVLRNAVELVREAKDVCQRHISQVERPGPPRNFQVETLCAEPGKRQIRIDWLPPEDQKAAPVRRYVVRVVDPMCGRALKVAVLEPDYLEELRRFVSVEELGSYVLAEQELHKMPGVWKELTATVQVAAANEAGESAPYVIELPLTAIPELEPAPPKTPIKLPFAAQPAGLRQTSPGQTSPTGLRQMSPSLSKSDAEFMWTPTKMNSWQTGSFSYRQPAVVHEPVHQVSYVSAVR